MQSGIYGWYEVHELSRLLKSHCVEAKWRMGVKGYISLSYLIKTSSSSVSNHLLLGFDITRERLGKAKQFMIAKLLPIRQLYFLNPYTS